MEAYRVMVGYLAKLIGEIKQLNTRVWRIEEDRWHLVILALFVALGIILRLTFLSQPMRYDEAFTYTVFTSRGFWGVVTNYELPNNHIFHTLLVAFVTQMLGNQPWIIRLPAFTAGVLLIPATYLVARNYFNRETGLISAGLVASSSMMVEYSTNARGYVLICLFTLCLLYVARRLRVEQSPIIWLLFVGMAAVGFYTVPTMLYPYGGIMTWLVFSWVGGDIRPELRRSFLVNLLLSGLAVLLLVIVLYLPAIFFSGLARLVDNQFVQPGSWADSFRSLSILVRSMWEHWTRDIPLPLAWLLVFGSVLTIFLHRQLSTDRISLAIAMLLWCLAFAVLSRRVPPWTRVFLFLLPLYFIWASAGLIYLLRKIARSSRQIFFYLTASGALLVAFTLGCNLLQSRSVYYSEQTGALRDAEAIATWLGEHYQDGDVVISYVPTDAPLQYYLDKAQIKIPHISQNGKTIDAHRAFVIVSKNNGQSLEYVLSKVDLQGKINLSAIRLVKSFPTADIFEIDEVDAVILSGS